MILSLACLWLHCQIHPLSFPLSAPDSCYFCKYEYSQNPECRKSGSVAQGLGCLFKRWKDTWFICRELFPHFSFSSLLQEIIISFYFFAFSMLSGLKLRKFFTVNLRNKWNFPCFTFPYVTENWTQKNQNEWISFLSKDLGWKSFAEQQYRCKKKPN